MKFSTLFVSFGLLVAGHSYAASITPFQLPWVNGGTDSVYKMADHPTGIFVLEAFQNFCEYCNANAPKVDAVYNTYKTQDRVQIIDLDLDTDQSEIQAWIDKYHPAYPLLSDDGTVFNQFGGDSGIPQTVVLDCKGNILVHTEGEWDDDAQKQITDAIDQQLATTCSVTK